MFRNRLLTRKSISPSWFEAKRKEISEIANALKVLPSRPETEENCRQPELAVVKRQDSSGSLEYKSIEQRKKEISKEQEKKQKELASKISTRQEHAQRARSQKPQTRSQFWLERNAEKVGKIKSARAQQKCETNPPRIDF